MPDPAASLLFLGDVVLDRAYPIDLTHPGIIFNLEGALARGPNPRQHTWNLCVDGCHLQETFRPPPVAATLANNHIMDYGLEAVEQTRRMVGGFGLQTFGAGTREDRFGNPLVLACGPVRVGLLGYAADGIGAQMGDAGAFGAAPLRLETIAGDVAALRRDQVDRIVVYPHWGFEHASLPTPETVRLAHQIIDLGVDLVVGTHAHCMQAGETYAGRQILYGMGNFIFPSRILPGQYGPDGQPTQFGRTILAPRMQHSLGVEYFPETGEVRHRFFHFDGERVSEHTGQLEDISAVTGDLEAYAGLYRRRTRRELFSYRVYSLFKNPDPARILRFLKHALTKE